MGNIENIKIPNRKIYAEKHPCRLEPFELELIIKLLILITIKMSIGEQNKFQSMKQNEWLHVFKKDYCETFNCLASFCRLERGFSLLLNSRH